jgi:hypothetical protein
MASASGNLDLLKWIKEQGCNCGNDVCSEASKNGRASAAHSASSPYYRMV